MSPLNDEKMAAFIKALEPEPKAKRVPLFWRVFWWSSAIMVVYWLTVRHR